MKEERNTPMGILDRVTESLKARFGAGVKAVSHPSWNRLFVDIERGSLRAASRALMELGARYQVGIGYDEISRNGTLGLVHSFAFDADHVVVLLRTSAPAGDPVVRIHHAGHPQRRLVRARVHGPSRDEVQGPPEAQAAHPGRRLARGHPPAPQGGPLQPRAAGGRGRRLPARRGPARDDDRPHRALPLEPPRARALRRLRRRRDHQGLRLPRLHDPSRHREALPDPGQLQRGPVRRRADLRHLRIGPRRLLLPGRGGGRRNQDLAAGRVHPDHHARDRAAPLATSSGSASPATSSASTRSSCRPGASGRRSCGWPSASPGTGRPTG